MPQVAIGMGPLQQQEGGGGGGRGGGRGGKAAAGNGAEKTGLKGKKSVRKWTAAEDAEMCRLVLELGTKQWGQIGLTLGGRSGKQCRERWHNQVRDLPPSLPPSFPSYHTHLLPPSLPPWLDAHITLTTSLLPSLPSSLPS